MNNRNAVRPANGLFNGLMILAGFTFMLVWLPLLRCLFDGSSYSWGQWYYGLSLTAIVLPLALLAAALIFLVIRKDRRVAAGYTSWGRSNWIKAAIILGPLVVQAFLFAGGEPQGITDQIAVVIAIAQAILVPIIFIPARE